MDRSIWALSSVIDPAREAAYLDWYRDVHIPEKLARPGYAWAAYYRALKGERHIAAFGALDVGAFLAPTPGQLKQRQDALTRDMMSARSGTSSGVFTEALRVAGPKAGTRSPGICTAPFIRYAHFDLPDAAAEDAAAAWVAQQRFPQLAASPGLLGARFMLSALGAGKYMLLEEYASEDALKNEPAAFPAGALHQPGSPFEGRRTNPA